MDFYTYTDVVNQKYIHLFTSVYTMYLYYVLVLTLLDNTFTLVPSAFYQRRLSIGMESELHGILIDNLLKTFYVIHTLVYSLLVNYKKHFTNISSVERFFHCKNVPYSYLRPTTRSYKFEILGRRRNSVVML